MNNSNFPSVIKFSAYECISQNLNISATVASCKFYAKCILISNNYLPCVDNGHVRTHT